MSEATTLDRDLEIQQWTRLVHDFCDEVAAWSEAQGWIVTRKEQPRSEELLGAYTVPELVIETGQGTIILEPVARMVMGASGRIDLFAYPTLFRVMLLKSSKDGRWRIRTDSGIYLKQPWNEETFVGLVADLIGAGDEP